MTAPPPAFLDWRDGQHSRRGSPLPCRYCGLPTWLLDELGLSSHKVCAEIDAAKSGNTSEGDG